MKNITRNNFKNIAVGILLPVEFKNISPVRLIAVQNNLQPAWQSFYSIQFENGDIINNTFFTKCGDHPSTLDPVYVIADWPWVCELCGYSFASYLTYIEADCPECGWCLYFSEYHHNNRGGEENNGEWEGGQIGGGGGGSGGGNQSSPYPNIKLPNIETSNLIRPIIEALSADKNAKNLLDFIKNKNVTIEREKNMNAMFKLVTSGDNFIIYFNTDYPDEQLLLHEISHIWYKMNYPDISLNKNLNAEIIALLSEYVYALNHPVDGMYNIANFYIRDIGSIIRPYLNDPTIENYQRLEDLFFQRRPIYKDFVPDKGTIIEQTKNFKNTIYNR